MYKNIIAKLLAELIHSISYENRKGKLHNIGSLIETVRGSHRKQLINNFVDLMEIDGVIFGEWGECGMAVFLNKRLEEVIRIAFEDSREIHSWILDVEDVEDFIRD